MVYKEYTVIKKLLLQDGGEVKVIVCMDLAVTASYCIILPSVCHEIFGTFFIKKWP
jgi:hypothetical protein